MVSAEGLSALRHSRITRRALVVKARAALDHGALVVVAPAGYGKTSLLHDALPATATDVAWVSCTARERHPGQLVAALVASIDEAVPGAAKAVAEALASSREVVDPLAALGSLEDELNRLLVERAFVVIDDAENLAGAGASCAIVTTLIRTLQPRLGVAVLSRRPLGLRLAKPRASGRIVTLGAADLAFTSAECAEYLRRSIGRRPSDREVDRLLEVTEGWPLAVATILHGREGETPGEQSWLSDVRSPEQLKAYLCEEVLDRLDPPARREVLVSALPRHLSPATAEALGLPADFVPGLRLKGLYLRNVDRSRDVIDYHPLFRELLLERLEAESEGGEVEVLHRRLAPALARDGDTAGAIEHWIAAGAWAETIAAIGQEARRLVVTSPGLLRAWLDRLPADLHRTPVVQLLEGHLALAAGRYDEARALLGAARAGVSPALSPANDWWCRYLLIDCLNMSGRPEEAVLLGDGFERPEARHAGVVAVAAGLYAAHILASMGRTEAAERAVAIARRLPEAEMVGPIDAVLWAYVDLPAGRLEMALERALAAYRQVESSDPLMLRFDVMATIATVLGEQGRIEESLEWWARQRAGCEAALMTARSRVVQGVQAQLLAQTGSFSEAEAALAGHRETGTWADTPFHLARCLLAAGRAEVEEAIAACATAVTVAAAAPPLYRYWTLVGLVPPLVRVGGLDRADEMLRQAVDLVGQEFPGAKGRFLRARVLVLEAWLAAERGPDSDAPARMVTGLLEAGEAAPHLLRLEWARIEPLLEVALADERLDPPTVVGWLWRAFPDGQGFIPLVEHPRPDLRRASFRPALSSGNPVVKNRVAAACDDDIPGVADAARRALERVASDPPARTFTTLGGFGVRVGGWEVSSREWARPVDARLVRFLLVQGDEPVPEDILLDAFWPKLAPDRARRSLHVSASRVRALLDHPGTESVVEAAQGCYRLLLRERDFVDWREFESVAATAVAEREPDRGRLERARSLWGGEPLPRERYSDWAAGWRDRMRHLYSEVLAALYVALDREGELGPAIRVARDMVQLDPLNEGAHRSLMSALDRAGRRGQALRQFLACRKVLMSELGIEPAEATSVLRARILTGV